MPKAFPCIESTENFSVGSFNIRIWRDEEEIFPHYNNGDIIRLVRDYLNYNLDNPSIVKMELINLIIAMSRVSAVEIQLRDSTATSHNEPVSGVVVYKVWP